MSHFKAKNHNPPRADVEQSARESIPDLTPDSTEKRIHLRIYVANGSPNSVNALANLKLICQRDLGVRFEVEVVDIWQEPGRALSDGILLTPTLRRLSPLPEINIIGDLSDIQAVINALDVVKQRESHPQDFLEDPLGKSSENF